MLLQCPTAHTVDIILNPRLVLTLTFDAEEEGDKQWADAKKEEDKQRVVAKEEANAKEGADKLMIGPTV